MAITSSGVVRKDCSYQMPGRILLSACDTAGRAARHSGEWLALAPAMMWAGARLVIATSWPTIDDPRTLEMDLALIEVLKNHDDPAEALRSLQVEKLQRWRDGMDDKDPLSPICGWSPLFWAPYIAVGFRQG
jgi:CHAT domain-containing protein